MSRIRAALAFGMLAVVAALAGCSKETPPAPPPHRHLHRLLHLANQRGNTNEHSPIFEIWIATTNLSVKVTSRRTDKVSTTMMMPWNGAVILPLIARA